MALPEVYNSVLGEPINQDHDQTFKAICGDITGSRYIPAMDDDPSVIRCTGVIFADDYPDVANKIRRGAGRWAAMSMEAIPNPLERVGKYLVVHMPKFIGSAIVRFPANEYSRIDQISDVGIGHVPPHRSLRVPQAANMLKEGVDIFLGKR